MHKVCLVLEQFIDAFDDVSLPEHDPVPHWHELVLHPGFQPVYEMYPLVKEMPEEFLLDVSSVCEYLSIEYLREDGPYTFVPVIDVGRC